MGLGLILVSGKIRPPTSVAAARDRLQQVECEIARIDRQLLDPARPLKYPTVRAYEDWECRAKDKQRYFRIEARQIQEWIDKQSVPAESEPVDMESEILAFWSGNGDRTAPSCARRRSRRER